MHGERRVNEGFYPNLFNDFSVNIDKMSQPNDYPKTFNPKNLFIEETSACCTFRFIFS